MIQMFFLLSILVGVFASLSLIYKYRYKVERESKSIQLAIDYYDIKKCLQACSPFSEKQILAQLKNKGLTTILLRKLDQRLIETISEVGLGIMLMINNFSQNTSMLDWYLQRLKQIPNLSVLILADKRGV